MKLLLLLLLPFAAMAQDTSYTIPGDYTISYGFTGRIVRLLPDEKFYLMTYHCLGKDKIDSGAWKVNGPHSVVLQWRNRRTFYTIVPCEGNLILLSDAEKAMFAADYRKAVADGMSVYSCLITKYFVRKL